MMRFTSVSPSGDGEKESSEPCYEHSHHKDIAVDVCYAQ